MRAAFFIASIQAIALQSTLALELKAYSALATPDTHVFDVNSLAQVDSLASYDAWPYSPRDFESSILPIINHIKVMGE